jgi:DNA-binding MarR family transcriptional regulator
MEAQGHITPRLDEELRAHSDLDFKSYDALLHTYEAGLEGIRMADLAERVVVSKSGLTSIVDRLEERGLVRRLPDHADRRATRISITETGVEAFRAAAEVHLDGIARYFAAHISNDEAKVLAEALERVREATE